MNRHKQNDKQQVSQSQVKVKSKSSQGQVCKMNFYSYISLSTECK